MAAGLSRANSADIKVNSEARQPIDSRLTHSSFLLFSDDEPLSYRDKPDDCAITLRVGSHTATAIAVDGDGYILTAAHAVHRHVYLLGYFDGAYHVREATIVYLPKPASPVLDYAILHVTGKVTHLPLFAEVPKPGTTAKALLPKDDAWELQDTVLRSAKNQSFAFLRPASQRVSLLSSGLSARPGQSGSAILTNDNQLIGIIIGSVPADAGNERADSTWILRPPMDFISRSIREHKQQSSKRVVEGYP